MAAVPRQADYESMAEERAALQRVATLVARAPAPGEVFGAVTEEAGRLLGAHHATMSRYGPDGAATVVASWSSAGAAFPAGSRSSIGGRNVATLVFQTRGAARIDDRDDASGPIAEAAQDLELRATVGVPVTVEGALWGVMAVGSRTGPLPAGTEAQLAGFTELAATAIANAQARAELREFADEQAALRRVATLVAEGASPDEVFASITREAGRLLCTDFAATGRYSPDASINVVATWSSTGATVPVSAQEELCALDLHTTVFQTSRPARIDDYAAVSGPVAEAVRALGLRAGVAVPVTVEGGLWGVMAVESRTGPLPTGTEAQLAGFTELAATAIANAEARAALTASRARIVATADATRRRLERNLHDGAQQHLVSLALDLRAAEATTPPGAEEHVHQLDEVAAGLDDVLGELREIARGLHPAILTDGGLRAALKALARRSPVPVRLDIKVEGRLSEPVEIAAYYTVAEALTNIAKHAHATTADVQVAESDGVLHLHIRDDGRGGANISHGSGLVGLKDRAEALGGRLQIHCPPGAGTTLEIELPLQPIGPDPPPEPG